MKPLAILRKSKKYVIGVLVGTAAVLSLMSSTTTAATNNYINFQSRLLNGSGSVVLDGNYNVEFKIYKSQSANASAQGTCVGGGTDDCLWMETRTGGNQVRVAGGYLSVQLGSVTSFPSMNWDQQLYLTMNIGGTGSPSWDGEMLSSGNRLPLTGVPYAFRAGALAATSGANITTVALQAPSASGVQFTIPNTGTSASGSYNICTSASASTCTIFEAAAGTDFIRNQTSVQTANFNIQSAANGSIAAVIKGASGQTADLLDIVNGASGNNVVSIGASGATVFQASTNSITAFQVQNSVGAPVLLVDTTSTAANGNQLNYITYPGFESGSFSNASAGWNSVSPGTLSQNSTRLHTFNGLYSAQVATTASNGGLTTSSFVSAPPSGTYLISFYAKVASSTMASTAFTVQTTDGATHTCSPSAGITINSSGFQRLYCPITATGAITALQITQNDSSARTIYIDSVQLQPNSFNGNTITAPTPYQVGALQLRGVITNPLALMSASNSTAAFSLQDANSNTLLNIDSSNDIIALGSTGTQALASTVNIATTSDATTNQVVTIGSNANNVNNITTIQGGSNTTAAIALTPNAAGGITIGASAGTGAITLGSSSATQNVLIANGSGSAAVSIANVQNGGSVSIGSGLTIGTITIGGNSQSGNLVLGRSTQSSIISIGSAGVADNQTQTINIGNSSANGTTSGGYTVNIAATNPSAANGVNAVNIGNAATGAANISIKGGSTGTIGIGSAAGTGAITLGSSSATQNVLIANGSGSAAVSIANVQNGGSVSVGSAMTTGTISLGGANTTGTITLGQYNNTGTSIINVGAALASAGTQQINIGNGSAGINTLVIGSTSSSSATTINAGTGNLSLSTGNNAGGAAGNITLTTGTSSSGSASIIAKSSTNSTAAFQIQNSAGTAILTADTTNQLITVNNLLATGTINLQNSQGAGIQLRTVSNSVPGGATALIYSGYEMTDGSVGNGTATISRSAALQGDGRQPQDSSTGFWLNSTNRLISAGSETGSGIADWNAVSSTRSFVSNTSKFGSKSLQVVTSNLAANEGVYQNFTASGSVYTFSAWVKGNSGTVRLRITTNTPTNTDIGNPVTLNGSWQRITLTTGSALSAATYRVYIETNVQQNITYYIDGVQAEAQTIATPYIETTTTTTARGGNPVVQAPISVSNGGQGWAAFRFRTGWSNGSVPGQPTLMDLTDGTNQDILYYTPGSNIWTMQRDNGGATIRTATQSAGTFSAGSLHTVVAAWTATSVSISVDGAAFTTTSFSSFTFTAGGTIAIGSQGTGDPIDGDMLWAGMGTGTLGSSDITALYNLGNSDPTLTSLQALNSGASAGTFAWDGEGSQYSSTDGAFSSNSQISIDDVNLMHKGNGSLVIQGATNSTTAFQIQNTAGTSLFTVDTTNNNVTIDNTGAAGTLQIGNTSGAVTQTINIGNNASGVNTIAIGSTNSSSGVSLRVGTGNFSLDGVTNSTYNVGASTTTGTITVGGTAQSGTFTLGSSSASNTQIIAGGSGATTLQIANVQNGGSVSVGSAMTTGTISLGGANTTGTITLGQYNNTGTSIINVGAALASAGTQQINIGNGSAGINTLVIGSGASSSGVTLNSGSTGVLVKSGASNNSATAFQVQNASSVVELSTDTSGNIVHIGSSTTDATAIVLSLDSYNQPTDPTGVTGAMYYNTNLSKFRCYTTGWVDCDTTGAGTGVTTVGTFSGSSQTNGATISGTTITFGPADTTNPGMVSTGTQTFAGSKTFKTTTNSTTGLQVQDAGAINLLALDTTNHNLTVGTYRLPYIGGADASTSTNTGTTSATVNGQFVLGNYEYVVTNGNATACSSTAGSGIGCELQVYNISNPASPSYIGGADSTGTTNSGTGSSKNFRGVFVSGSYAYVVTGSDGSASACSQSTGAGAAHCEFMVFDVSTPSAPTYAAGRDSNGSATGTGTKGFNAIYVSGTNAYITSANSGSGTCSGSAGSASPCELEVYSVSTPTSPSYSGGADAAGGTNTGANTTVDFNSVYVSGSYAYVVTSGNTGTCSNTSTTAAGCELQAWDISTPSTPTYKAGEDASGTLNGGTAGVNINGVSGSGNYVYTVANGNASTCSATPGSAIGCELRAFDISGLPTTITYVGGNDINGNSNSGSSITSTFVENSVYALGNYLYIALNGSTATCSQSAGTADGCELQVYSIATKTTPSYLAGVDSSGQTASGTAGTGFNSAFATNNAIYAAMVGSTNACTSSIGGNGASTDLGCENLVFNNNVVTPNLLTASSNTGVVTVAQGLTVNGSALFQNNFNSTTAFQVQDSSGNNYIQVDTSGANLYLGNPGLAGTVQIGNTTGAVAQTLNLGTNATSSSTTTINIGSQSTGTNTINIGAGTSSGTLNIGNGSNGTTHIQGSSGDILFGNGTTTFGVSSAGAVSAAGNLTLTASNPTISATTTGVNFLTIQTATSTSLTTGSIKILTGNSTGGAAASGSITIDTGTGSNGTGTISIGTGNASGITIGNAGSGLIVDITLQGHIKSSQQTALTIGTPTNCGTSPTAAVATGSTDSAGSFRITAGTGAPTTCDTVITFNTTYTTTPKSILVVAETQDGGTGTASARQIYVSAASATTFTVKMNSAPAASEVNWYYYWVIK